MSASSNRYILVTVGSGDATAGDMVVTTLTVGGAGCTNKWALNGPAWVRSEGWEKVGPGTGAQTVAVTYTGTCDQVCAGAISYTDVDPTTPSHNVTTGSGSGANPSITVTSASGEVVISGVSSDDGPGLTISTGTERWKVLNVGSDTAYGESTDAGAASVTMTWTASANNWAMGGLSIYATGAAPGSANRRFPYKLT